MTKINGIYENKPEPDVQEEKETMSSGANICPRLTAVLPLNQHPLGHAHCGPKYIPCQKQEEAYKRPVLMHVLAPKQGKGF